MRAWTDDKVQARDYLGHRKNRLTRRIGRPENHSSTLSARLSTQCNAGEWNPRSCHHIEQARVKCPSQHLQFHLHHFSLRKPWHTLNASSRHYSYAVPGISECPPPQENSRSQLQPSIPPAKTAQDSETASPVRPRLAIP